VLLKFCASSLLTETSENAKASLEEIHKRNEDDKAVWQREKKEMQQQVNRLQEEVLAAANANAWLEEMQQQVNRLKEEVLAAANANAYLEEIRVQQHDHINKLLNSEKMWTKQVTPEFDAERLGKKEALQQNVAEQTKKTFGRGQRAGCSAIVSGAAS
jgi:hypothetical protein